MVKSWGSGWISRGKRALLSFLGCHVGKLPSIYLGLPMRIENPRKALWDHVVERFERRLSTWKGRFGQLSLLCLFILCPLSFVWLVF